MLNYTHYRGTVWRCCYWDFVDCCMLGKCSRVSSFGQLKKIVMGEERLEIWGGTDPPGPGLVFTTQGSVARRLQVRQSNVQRRMQLWESRSQ